MAQHRHHVAPLCTNESLDAKTIRGPWIPPATVVPDGTPQTYGCLPSLGVPGPPPVSPGTYLEARGPGGPGGAQNRRRMGATCASVSKAPALAPPFAADTAAAKGGALTCSCGVFLIMRFVFLRFAFWFVGLTLPRAVGFVFWLFHRAHG